MSLPFGPIFLICLLFADLTDDVIALVYPAMPVAPPSSVLDETVPLSIEYRNQCDERIRPIEMSWRASSVHQVFLPLCSPEEVRGTRLLGLHSAAIRLYVLMSLQR